MKCLFISSCVVGVLVLADVGERTKKFTQQDLVRSVEEAILDEFWDRSYVDCFKKLPSKLIAHIKPLSSDQTSAVIYEFPLPFGEVYREAYLQKNGLVILAENHVLPPYDESYAKSIKEDKDLYWWAFRPTKSWAMRTVYMDSNELTKMKKEWRKIEITMRKPTKNELEKARKREAQRYKLVMSK